MWESVLHFFGLCPDNMAHPNLLNMFGLLTFFAVILRLMKEKIINFKNKIIKFIWKNKKS